MKKLTIILIASILFASCSKETATSQKDTIKQQQKQESQLVEQQPAKADKVARPLPPQKTEVQQVIIADEYLEEEAEEMEYEMAAPMEMKETFTRSSVAKKMVMSNSNVYYNADSYQEPQQQFNTESYAYTAENEYKAVDQEPLSTFSIDVDAASYSNSRRFLKNGSLPPKDAVRIEEFINYFSYDYEKPMGEDPFSITTEYSACPWNKKHQLLHVGLQGKRYDFEEMQSMNLVFLIDVSGSMSNANKLPLLKKSFDLMTQKLRANDKISIVVYAGAAGLVLPPTPGNQRATIMNALNNLNAGGSTAGGAGIKLAYKIAKENYIDGGINRVLLATDGDFNIGQSSDGEMTRLLEEKRDEGIFITTLGFGMGNYKDSKMETIADKGNGNYFYIDDLAEARKTLVTQLDGTLYTIAKDVKIQIEFNPNKVKGYRLIGYVNRKLNKEDFNDDKKDAGELGAGHTVTALYEIIPASSDEKLPNEVDALRYQQPAKKKVDSSNEIATVKLRYKQPDGNTSKLLVKYVNDRDRSEVSDNYNFSAAVAGFGMILRDSKYLNNMSYKDIIKWASASKGVDEEGYRSEFIQLVKMAELVDTKTAMK